MFWFQKNHPNVLYVDIRKANKGHIAHLKCPEHSVEPDKIVDFRSMPFEDKSFRLIVFDPPHIVREKPSVNSLMFGKYGTLTKGTWAEDLKKGFDECWRVLMDYGVIVFKWAESDRSITEVLKIINKQPLFGHPVGSNLKTHWMVFMKIPGYSDVICTDEDEGLL